MAKDAKVKVAPSRQGKKQVIAFLRPDQAEAAYAKAAHDGMTNQEILGQALNAFYASKGVQSPVQMGHRRIVRRIAARAVIRTDGRVPTCRAGKIAYGGWFDKDVVDKLHREANSWGLSVQGLIEIGIYYVTGVEVTTESSEPQAFAFPKNFRTRTSANGVDPDVG
jgi:hypothetical protein